MGPVILAVMVAVWREWLEHADDLTASSQENTET
jgi:hypothetical protein